jgi:hypothetical protein
MRIDPLTPATNPWHPQFRTHSNYLRAFATLAAGKMLTRSSEVYERCAQRALATGSLPSKQLACDTEQVHASLRHAWGTELVLGITARVSNADELVRLANNWLAVQVYYCVYHATQAVAVAAGHPRPEEHTTTQRLFADTWAKRGASSLTPWCLACVGDELRNVDTSIVDRDVQPLRSFEPSAASSLACKALKTTHEHLVVEQLPKRRKQARNERKRVWETTERTRVAQGKRPRRMPRFAMPNFTAAERASITAETRPATLIDYLYRLRIHTNYRDASTFTQGPSEPTESQEVRWCFGALAGTTLLLSEIAVMRRLGKQQVTDWATAWKKANLPPDVSAGLAARLEVLDSLSLG